MPAPYRFDVNIANAEIVFTNAANGDIEYAINLYTVVDVTAQVKQTRVYGLANGVKSWLPTSATYNPWATIANDATMLQDEWPDPASTSPATPTTNTQISQDYGAEQWFVRIHLNDQRFMDIPMGKVVNQDWPNDETGASLCIQAILAEITMP
jgi:hypothetical protein